MSVKRYGLSNFDSIANIRQMDDGEYVLHSDYEKLAGDPRLLLRWTIGLDLPNGTTQVFAALPDQDTANDMAKELSAMTGMVLWVRDTMVLRPQHGGAKGGTDGE